MVHKYIKTAKKKQAKSANKNRKEVKLEVGDAVYHRNHHKHSKLNSNWKPFYRIIEETTPVSFKIRNQLDDTIAKAHAEHLHLANVDEWDIPKDNTNKPIRHVINPEISDSDSISSEISENNIGLNKIDKRYRKEHDTSSDEEDIPLMELSNKLKQRQIRPQHQNEANSSSDKHSD